MFKKIILLIYIFIICLFFNVSVKAFGFDDEFALDDDMSFEQGKRDYGLAVSGWAGINDPKNGYAGYRTNPAGGGDIRLLFRRPKGIKYYCSFAVEYFPLALPEKMPNFTEDILAVNINMAMNYLKFKRYIPYFGVGLGYYWDMLSQDIKNFGSRSSTETYFGFNGHLGLEYRISPYISICPQYQIHYISQAGIYATIPLYSIKAVIYIGRKLDL